MTDFLSEFPLPSMSRHSSSSALTRRSSASTVISASRYESNAPAYRDFGISGVPDDAVGEYLKEARQKQSKFIHSCALKPECPVHSYYVNSHHLSVHLIVFWLLSLLHVHVLCYMSLYGYTHLKFGARNGYKPICLVMRKPGIHASTQLAQV